MPYSIKYVVPAVALTSSTSDFSLKHFVKLRDSYNYYGLVI